ncbi:glutaredoxin family protein [Mycolicibacterium sp. S2-37]|uniref:glutaredoxin family protein n=1 Tax=Mycolicibacterium sp. S2-37 TaxID=2810297 RepID=UPI0035ABB1BA
MEVTLYHPDAPCPKCTRTKALFEKDGIPYTSVIADETLIKQFQEEGHMSYPVVRVDLGDGATWSWSDLRVTEIKRLAELLAS